MTHAKDTAITAHSVLQGYCNHSSLYLQGHCKHSSLYTPRAIHISLPSLPDQRNMYIVHLHIWK